MRNIIFVFAFLLVSSAFASSEPTVPMSWITLPEEGPRTFTLGDENPEKLEKLVDKIFTAQYEALSEAPLRGISQIAPNNRPKDWVPWRFVAFVSDLTISAQGVLGVLTFKGTPGVSVYWQKRESFPKPLAQFDRARAGVTGIANESPPEAEQREAQYAAGERSNVDIAVNETTSAADLEKQIASMEKTILASGRIQKTAPLKANLARFVHEFAAMASSLGDAPVKGDWYPSRLRVDLQIAASGDIAWGTAGGDVRVRLEWFRIKEKPKVLAGGRFRAKAATEASLHELVGALSEDLGVLSEKSPSPNFEAASFRVGLGIGIEGKIGVAKASAKAFGHVYFSRAAKPKAFVAHAMSNDSIYLIDSSQPEAVAFAARNGIRTLAAPGEDTMFKIDRARFRKGLGMAITISRFFTRRATENSKSDWAISVIKPEFTMSVTGELGLSKLTGFATAQIDFQNKNF